MSYAACHEVSRILPGDGLALHVDQWLPAAVSGPTVVLLHGITGSASSWRPVARRLAAGGRQVIVPDARGHGASDWSAEEAYAPDQHFADLALLLEGLPAGPCVVVGFSMGGAVATMYAAARPDLVAALVTVDAYPAPEISPGSRRIAASIAAAYTHLAAMGAPFDPAIARRLRDDLAAGEALRLDNWPLWDALTVPTLVVRGEHSDVLTVAMATEMLARQSRSRLHTVRGAGHAIPVSHPAELADAILAVTGNEGSHRNGCEE